MSIKHKRRLQRFIAEYPVDLCARAAAIRAGYAPGSARVVGPRLQRRPDVEAALEARMEVIVERAHVTVQRIVGEAARIAFADLRRLHRADGR
jgi:phage terminase small subunit